MRTKQGKSGMLTIKVDLEKAYDRLRWNFIHANVLDAGMPPAFISLVMKCISSVSMQVLFNGQASEAFEPSRGVRQGDSLSP